VILFIGAVFGELLSTMMAPKSLGVGGSALTMALFGAMYADYYHNSFIFKGGKIGYLVRLTMSCGINFVFGIFPYVDNWALIGGLISGFFTSMVLFSGAFPHSRQGYRDRNYFATFCSLGLLIIIYLFVLSIVFGGIDFASDCELCHQIGCVDTQYWTCARDQVCYGGASNPTTGVSTQACY
jgi:hypothetical protein